MQSAAGTVAIAIRIDQLESESRAVGKSAATANGTASLTGARSTFEHHAPFQSAQSSMSPPNASRAGVVLTSAKPTRFAVPLFFYERKRSIADSAIQQVSQKFLRAKQQCVASRNALPAMKMFVAASASSPSAGHRRHDMHEPSRGARTR